MKTTTEAQASPAEAVPVTAATETDTLGSIITVADAMVDERARGYCDCAVTPATCGHHALADAGDDYEARYLAIGIAGRQAGVEVDHETAEAYGLAVV